MIDDTDTLTAVLDEYEPVSFGEKQVIGGARAALRAGVEPAQVLAHLERHRELMAEWTAYESEHGYVEALKRWAGELREWWEVCRHSEAAKREWALAHPVFAPHALADMC